MASALRGREGSGWTSSGSLGEKVRRRSRWCSTTGKLPVPLTVVQLLSLAFGRHGGGGYQSSWGSASIALELLEKALASASET